MPLAGRQSTPPGLALRPSCMSVWSPTRLPTELRERFLQKLALLTGQLLPDSVPARPLATPHLHLPGGGMDQSDAGSAGIFSQRTNRPTCGLIPGE
eukprot:3983761-Pyramimonas_sp.AAC.1